MRRLFSKLAAWVVHKTFIYFSRHVSYPDFRIIWEQAYQASVEAEWSRMRMVGMTTSPLNSMPTNPTQEGQEAGVEAPQKELRSKLISPRLEPEGGQEEKQPPSPPSQPQSQSKLKYKRKGA